MSTFNLYAKPLLTGLVAAAALLATSLPADAASALVYAPLGNADQIAVIDTTDYHVVGSVDGVLNTHGSALTPNGRYLVAGSLTVRNSNAAPARPAGVSPSEHAAHHHASSQGNAATKGMLYLIDTATRKVVRQFDVPGPVHHVLVTSDGRYAISTHPMGGGISVLALQSGQVVATVATGPNPNYMAESNDGRTLYVSNAGNGTVSEVDTDNWYVRRNLRLGGSPEHLVLDGKRNRLYVNDVAGGNIVALNLTSGSVIARYPVGPQPHGIALGPSDDHLYATSKTGNRLVAVDLTNGSIRSVMLGPAPYHVALNPADGRLLVTSQAQPSLWIVDPSTLNTIQTVKLPGEAHELAVTP